MKSLIEPITTDVKLRRLVINMIYVGVLGELLGIEEAEIERALDGQLGHKQKALELNHRGGARRRRVGASRISRSAIRTASSA